MVRPLPSRPILLPHDERRGLDRRSRFVFHKPITSHHKQPSNQKPGTLSKLPSTRSTITYSAPSPRTILTLPIFILASGIQNDCHGYLASLKKYTLPIHPIFKLLICPHYSAECLIYLSLAVISAPKGAWVNRTLFTAFLFVVANLSVTASGTKRWYEGNFGKEAVRGRWTMVPFVW